MTLRQIKSWEHMFQMAERVTRTDRIFRLGGEKQYFLQTISESSAQFLIKKGKRGYAIIAQLK
jgi:hypothetical protein